MHAPMHAPSSPQQRQSLSVLQQGIQMLNTCPSALQQGMQILDMYPLHRLASKLLLARLPLRLHIAVQHLPSTQGHQEFLERRF